VYGSVVKGYWDEKYLYILLLVCKTVGIKVYYVLRKLVHFSIIYR
jgi:hypothetical protein